MNKQLTTLYNKALEQAKVFPYPLEPKRPNTKLHEDYEYFNTSAHAHDYQAMKNGYTNENYPTWTVSLEYSRMCFEFFYLQYFGLDFDKVEAFLDAVEEMED